MLHKDLIAFSDLALPDKLKEIELHGILKKENILESTIQRIYRLFETIVETFSDKEGTTFLINVFKKTEKGTFQQEVKYKDLVKVSTKHLLLLMKEDDISVCIGQNDDGDVYQFFNYYIVIPFDSDSSNPKLILYQSEPPYPTP